MIFESFFSFIQFECFNEIQVVELYSIIGIGTAQHLKLLISQRNLVVIQNRSHASERHSSYLGDIFVHEVRFEENTMFANHLTQSTHQGVDLSLISFGVGDGVVEVFRFGCWFLLVLLCLKDVYG